MIVNVHSSKTLLRAGYDPSDQTIIIIHGFNGTEASEHMGYLRDGELEFTKIIIIMTELIAMPYDQIDHILFSFRVIISLLVPTLQCARRGLVPAHAVSLLHHRIGQHPISRPVHGTGKYFRLIVRFRFDQLSLFQMYAYLTHKGSHPKRITCVGHSLGAHICGMMGNHLSVKQHKIIGRCT